MSRLIFTLLCLGIFMLGAAVSGAAPHASGRYTGTITIPPSNIKFKLVPGRVKQVTTDRLPVPCENGTIAGTSAGGSEGSFQHHRFKVRGLGGAQDHRIEGTVSGRHASGRLRFTALVNAQGPDPHGTILCNTGWLRWTATSRDRSAARRSRGRFRGKVANFHPHIEFNASTATIDRASTTIVPEPCTDGVLGYASFNGAAPWTAIPIQAERFTAMRTAGASQGSTLSGKLDGGRASGTLRILHKFPTSPGVTCDSGRLSWSAAVTGRAG
jgi:hypothetical protein